MTSSTSHPQEAPALPTIERLRELFTYDPVTGLVRARFSKKPYKEGRVASKYPTATVDGKTFRRHHVAWALHYGVWPQALGLQVDHINGDGHDNRMSNLRLATMAENNRNRRAMSRNKLGLKGVTRQGSAFAAHIRTDGVQEKLGTYPCPYEAHAAYRQAAARLHGEFACASR